jgi:hypothetical protein
VLVAIAFGAGHLLLAASLHALTFELVTVSIALGFGTVTRAALCRQR